MSSDAVPLPSQTIGWRPNTGAVLTLMPGEVSFGQGQVVKTLLGSCVAITLWHPVRRIGGMCHYVLPQRQRPPRARLDARYGDEAIATLVLAIECARVRPEEFVCHLYGGADTLLIVGKGLFNVGERNVELAWTLIDRHGFHIDGIDVGDDVPRNVSLDLRTGEVKMRRVSAAATPKGRRA